jgi:hypothetical protein
MTPSAAATAPAGEARVLEVVNEFYESNPFPGFNPGKYETRRDLVARASWYGKMIDAEIPYGSSVVDVGCGTGQLPCFLALKDRRVMGVDYSQHSLDWPEPLDDWPSKTSLPRVTSSIGTCRRTPSTTSSATACCTIPAIPTADSRIS